MRSADLAAKLPGVKRRGAYFDTTCPAHPDHDPSLSFSDGDVAIRFLCRSGCTHEAVALAMAALVHANPQDFFFRRNGREPVAVYTYTTHEGEVVYQECKFPDGTFKLRRPDPQHADRWIWNMQSVPKLLYNLPELLGATCVLYVEGPKDVETCRGLGLVATTHVGGAKAFRPEYARQLKQAMAPDGWVAVLRDEDEPGIAMQGQVLAAGHTAGLKLKQIILPGLTANSGGDITDWINAGHLKAELLAIIAATAEWTPEAVDIESEIFAASESSSEDAPPPERETDDEWPAPTPISTTLAPVPAFDLALLPVPFADWVRDIAKRVSCPIDYVAIAIMVVLASVVGRQVGIRPKEHDDWTVIPNLWGRVIGPPGVLKSPALREALRPLDLLIAEAKQDHEQALKDYEFAKLRYDAERKKIDKQLKDAVANDQDVAPIRKAFEALTEPTEPTERRYLVNDSTVEKLGELLNENPKGLLQFRDEDSGFLHMMDREGNENARAFFCEAWNGNSSYTYDRIERGTIYIKAACLSKLGGIQPGPLRHYLQEVFGSGERDDGFVQRDQLLVYPDVPTWEDVDEIPDSAARQRVTTILRRLADLDVASIGAHEKEDEIPYLRFTPEAQVHFRTWRAGLEHRIRHGEEHSIVLNHLAKYRSLMPSLALLTHLVACVDRGIGGPVSETEALRAIRWCEYLEPHTRRVYENLTAAGRINAAHLVRKLKALRHDDLPNPFRARTVQLKGWAGLTNAEAVKEALEILEEHGYVRKMGRPTTDRGGRPTEEYLVHPSIVKDWR